MRGTFGDFSRSVSLLATLTVTGLLTIAAGANLRFADGIAGGTLFLDGSKNASSTARLQVDGNTGTLSASSTITSTGGNIATAAGVANIVCNGANANCTIGQTNGTGGFLQVNSGGDTTFQTWNGSSFTPRMTVEGNQSATEINIFGGVSTTAPVTSTRFIANSTALNQGFRIANGTISGGFSADTSYLYAGTQSNHSIRFYINNGSILDLSASALSPSLTTDTINLGSSAARFGTGFFASVSSTLFSGSAGTAGAPTYSLAGAGEADSGMYSDAVGSVAISADSKRNLVVRSTAVFVGPSLQPFSAGAASIGTDTVPFGGLFASTTAATSIPAITSTGTLRIANQASPTTTIDLTGRLCIKALDMVGGTQRYLTIAAGSLVVTTTDCRQ